MRPDTVTGAHRRTWRAVVLRGLLAVGFGGFILAKPPDSLAAFALLIAIWALGCGATEIVHAIDIRPYFGLWWLLLLSGLVSAGFGVAALRDTPGLSLASAVRWVSFWLALAGFGVVSGIALLTGALRLTTGERLVVEKGGNS